MKLLPLVAAVGLFWGPPQAQTPPQPTEPADSPTGYEQILDEVMPMELGALRYQLVDRYDWVFLVRVTPAFAESESLYIVNEEEGKRDRSFLRLIFEDALDRSIRFHDKLLLILSENALSSAWVEEEVQTAIQRERTKDEQALFPVRLDDAIMEATEPWAEKVKRRHIGDFTRWKEHDAYRAAFQRLLRDLKAETGTGAQE